MMGRLAKARRARAISPTPLVLWPREGLACWLELTQGFPTNMEEWKKCRISQEIMLIYRGFIKKKLIFA